MTCQLEPSYRRLTGKQATTSDSSRGCVFFAVFLGIFKWAECRTIAWQKIDQPVV